MRILTAFHILSLVVLASHYYLGHSSNHSSYHVDRNNNTTSYSRVLSLLRNYEAYPLTNQDDTVHFLYIFESIDRRLRQLLISLSSLLELRSCSVHLHFVTDAHSEALITEILHPVKIPGFSYAFYSDLPIVEAQYPITNFTKAIALGWGHLAALRKASPELVRFPDDVKDLLMVDFDVLYIRDICAAYKQQLKPMLADAGLLLAPEQSNIYGFGTFAMIAAPVPLEYRWGTTFHGLNSGVVAVNVTRLREIRWTASYVKVFIDRTYFLPKQTLRLPEQNIFNIMSKHYKGEVIRCISPTFNFQFAHHSWSDIYLAKYSTERLIILHGNNRFFVQDTFLTPALQLFLTTDRDRQGHYLRRTLVGDIIYNLLSNQTRAL